MGDKQPHRAGCVAAWTVNAGERGVVEDPAAWLEDWVTLWQSELAGLVLDREVQEAQLRAIDAWAAQAREMAKLWARALEPQAHERGGGPAAAAGATAAVAAPDERDARIERLLARVDELERRLARLEPP